MLVFAQTVWIFASEYTPVYLENILCASNIFMALKDLFHEKIKIYYEYTFTV
jgi:hypothetical protein